MVQRNITVAFFKFLSTENMSISIRKIQLVLGLPCALRIMGDNQNSNAAIH